MGSTRFPGKPLVDLCGKPMIQWVVEACRAANLTEQIIVATPDPEIQDACHQFGVEVCMTRADHPSGTDRIAEVTDHIAADILVNVQGDEPLIHPDSIRACAQPLLDHPEERMASLFAPCPEDEFDNPAVVKVVTDLAGHALYFSRHCIPYPRNPRAVPVKKHIGLYAYRREVVRQFASWSPTPLELTESLEQLRFLENGIPIIMSPGQGSAYAVDTPEQAEQVRHILSQQIGR